MAFYSCLHYNLEETRKKVAQDADVHKFEEEDLIVKVGECLKERVKERALNTKDAQKSPISGLSLENARNVSSKGIGTADLFDEDENATLFSGAKSTRKSRKEFSSYDVSGTAKTTGRGRGRGRGRASNSLKQTTLDAAIGFRHSQRSASVAASASVCSLANEEDEVESDSNDETEKPPEINDVADSSDDAEAVRGKGRKRAAPRGRGRGATASKRGRKSDSTSSSFHRLLSSKDDEYDDDDDEDNLAKKLSKSQPRVSRNYGALRR